MLYNIITTQRPSTLYLIFVKNIIVYAEIKRNNNSSKVMNNRFTSNSKSGHGFQSGGNYDGQPTLWVFWSFFIFINYPKIRATVTEKEKKKKS